MQLNKEKYLNYELGLTVLFFLYYIFFTFQALNNNENSIIVYFHVVVGYTAAVIILVLLMLFFTKSKSIENDERDQKIELMAYRNAYLTAIGIINVLVILALFVDSLFKPFIIFNILFSTIFISHIIHSATQLFYFKRGI